MAGRDATRRNETRRTSIRVQWNKSSGCMYQLKAMARKQWNTGACGSIGASGGRAINRCICNEMGIFRQRRWHRWRHRCCVYVTHIFHMAAITPIYGTCTLPGWNGLGWWRSRWANTAGRARGAGQRQQVSNVSPRRHTPAHQQQNQSPSSDANVAVGRRPGHAFTSKARRLWRLTVVDVPVGAWRREAERVQVSATFQSR